MTVSFRLFGLTTVILFLTACTGNTAKPTPAVVAKTDSVVAKPAAPAVDKTVKTDAHNRLNDVALYLAGMKPDSFVAIPEKLQKLHYYQLYSDSMNKGFEHIEATRLSKMREWAKTELAPELAAPKTVFYPFSGPDILHCVQFFPDADQYIMVALERYGSLPVMEKMDSSRTVHTLGTIQKSLEDIFGKSYFITYKMVHDISNQWNGFTPVASVFLVRAGYSILDIKYKHLLDDGKTMVEIPLDSMSKHTNDCVEIYFKKKGGDKVQKLTYFKANLGDDPFGMPGLKTNTGLKAFLDNLPECYTYAKSASYLMCQTNFSIIRNACIAKSKTILQDDTGIAFGFLDSKVWKIKLFGSYVKPISDFKGGYYQPLLEKAYKTDTAHIAHLPFSLGYLWRDQQSQNLMKFERR